MNINSKDTTLQIQTKNILKEEFEYKTIKTDDIVAVHAEDSGFQSLKAVIFGVFLIVIGIQLTSFFQFSTPVQVVFILALLSILYGVQRSYELDLEYHSMSQTLPISVSGTLEFEGTGALPISPRELASSLFDMGTSDIMNVKTSDGFLGFISQTNTLRVTNHALIGSVEKTQFTPSTHFILPLKNIISINVAPVSFKSLKLGILGVFVALGGVGSISSSLFSGLLYTVFGAAMIIYGFSRVMKTTFTYSITGNEVKSYVFSGKIVETTHNMEDIGEIVMGAVVNNLQELVQEVPAK